MHALSSISRGTETVDAPPRHPLLATMACLAVAVPALIAFNVAPSATFFNQVAAYVGWGSFLLVIGTCLPQRAWPRARGSVGLMAALALLIAAALAGPLWAHVPVSLSLSSAGTIASALLVVATAACAARAGLAEQAFRAFCIALVLAGVVSSAIGVVQVFAPTLPDGDWIAQAALPGRATGNMRQPNHLSSLLLWSIVAAVWLGEARVVHRHVAAALALVFTYVIVLSASRTGALGMLVLALWGLLDRRQSKSARVLLLLTPLLYGAAWWGTSVWATHSHHLFGGQTRFGGSGDISSSRFGIWSNTLELISTHPWFGVGFGEFNFAWSLTPFPGRPVAFFDHTHNIVLNFAVELGVPLAAVVLGLLVFALWHALRNAMAEGDPAAPADASARPSSGEGVEATRPRRGVRRAAFVIVILVAMHSLLEYPLWYAHFLLPAAFAFGLCLEQADPRETLAAATQGGDVTRPFVLAAMLLVLGGTLALYDYMRVVIIFAPPAHAAPLEQRIADGRRSILFAHHADYAAATVAEHPGKVMKAFERAPHFLLDSRLMLAWAKALDENRETDKARYVAARLKEFRNEQADEFFAPCAPAGASAPARAASAASVPGLAAPPPFQCLAPVATLRFEDFR